jgi:hypothetical protein
VTILEKAYEDLEERSISEKHTHSLSDIFKEARDTLFSGDQESEAKKAQYEIDFLNFNINGNKLSFLYSGTNEKGEAVEYPSLKLFTEETYNYLIERQKTTKAPNLKARYSHILWLSPKKKIEFAKTAIDEYLKLIPIREQQDNESPSEHFGLKVLENIKNAFLLSASIKYDTDKLKKEVLRIVNDYSFSSTSSFAMRLQLIDLMLKHKKIFEPADYAGIVNICEKLIEDNYTKSKHSAIDILTKIINVEKKLGNDIVKYERRIAEVWEALSLEREDDTNLVSTEFCKNAIKIYKIIKDVQKVKELEKKFNELRKNIKLSEFGQEIDLSEMMKEFRKYADKLSENEPFAIIRSLMTDKGLLPTYEEVEKQAQENSKHSFLSHLANSSILDRNGNTAQYFSDEDEHNYYEILQSYHFSLELSKSNLIREIFFACIKKKKLTADTILGFLNQYSWLGKELQMSTNGGKTIPYCWLALIAPALNEYFVNLEFYLRNPVNYPNFILCIDSLVLKIEGMLRDVCEFKGVTTYKFRTDKKGRTISQEKDIHELLYEEEVTKLIDKDDLLFFKFLLVEKAGYNLRHKVAHSLMTFYEYNIHYMNLLIMAVLKFGKYDFVPKRETVAAE